jgi:hypothetical protein
MNTKKINSAETEIIQQHITNFVVVLFFFNLLFCIVFFLGYNSVDGHWGSWSAWSSCDVTCENGTQTRSRTCTDPAPAHGGIDCIGSNITTKSCSRKLCPGKQIICTYFFSKREK